jgi:hypothetical protein
MTAIRDFADNVDAAASQLHVDSDASMEAVKDGIDCAEDLLLDMTEDSPCDGQVWASSRLSDLESEHQEALKALQDRVEELEAELQTAKDEIAHLESGDE